jgi:hypothetical protein
MIHDAKQITLNCKKIFNEQNIHEINSKLKGYKCFSIHGKLKIAAFFSKFTFRK